MINQISRELPHQYILREDLVVHFSAELSMVYKSFTTLHMQIQLKIWQKLSKDLEITRLLHITSTSSL